MQQRATASSYALDGEDVVLLRALGHVPEVDLGLVTNAPDLAVARAQGLIQARWHPHLVVAGPEDDLASEVRDFIRAHPAVQVLWCSALGRPFDVVNALPRSGPRPWVVILDGVDPGSDDLGGTASSRAYRPTLFDGVSLYLAAEEHAELVPMLSYPRCSRDDVLPTSGQADAEAAAGPWRDIALSAWADAATRALTSPGADHGLVVTLERELDAVRQTLSWRVTRPLRALGGRRFVHRLRSRLRRAS